MCSNMFDLLWRKGVNEMTNDNTDDCIITLYNILKKWNFDIFKIKKKISCSIYHCSILCYADSHYMILISLSYLKTSVTFRSNHWSL